MATYQNLLEAAVRKLGRLESGGSLTASEVTDGIAEMNRMLGTWNADMGPIFCETLDSLTWASGNASRTIGTGGDLNVARPMQIVGAQIRSGTTDIDLTPITHREYQAIVDKATTASIPLYLAYNPTIASSVGTLFMWPVPSASLTIRITSLKPLVDGVAATTVTLPPSYEDAIVLNLALRLADEYGAQPGMLTIKMAALAKKAMKEANFMALSQNIQMDPLAPGFTNYGDDPMRLVNG